MKQNLQLRIAKEIFVHLKKISDNFLNEAVNDCIITVPAYYDEEQDQA